MSDIAAQLLALRIVVLALGEQTTPKWWPSQFMSPVGLSFLRRVYPRTAFAAAVRSASRAACALQDGSIGKGAVSHLFRLPPSLEHDIESALVHQAPQLEATYAPLLADRNALMLRLAALAGDQTAPASIGPVHIQTAAKDLGATLAAYYLAAFSQGAQVFPYIEGTGVIS